MEKLKITDIGSLLPREICREDNVPKGLSKGMEPSDKGMEHIETLCSFKSATLYVHDVLLLHMSTCLLSQSSACMYETNHIKMIIKEQIAAQPWLWAHSP